MRTLSDTARRAGMRTPMASPAPTRWRALGLTRTRVWSNRTVVGLQCKDGVVLGVEKMLISKMLVPGTNRRVHTVEKHIGMVSTLRCTLTMQTVNVTRLCPLQSIAGLVPDGRVLVNRAREESRSFLKNYGIKMTGDVLCERIAGYMHVYSLYEWLRPFGCGVMIATWDEDGPALYVVEPDGSGYKYYGCALGKAKQQARTMIETLKLEELTCRQAVVEIAKILHSCHDELKDKNFEVEMSWICDESGREHQLVPDDIVAAATEEAKAALESDDSDSDEDEDVAMAD